MDGEEMKTLPELTENDKEAIVEAYIDSEDFFLDFAEETMTKDSYIRKIESIEFEEVPPAFITKWMRNKQ